MSQKEIEEFNEYSRDFGLVMRAIAKIVTMPEEHPRRESTNVPVADLKAFARVVQYQANRIAELEGARFGSVDANGAGPETNPDSAIREVRDMAAKLLSLMNNPEPGLITWNQAVRETILAIAAHAGR